jgi:4-hydroxy-2-oxoheptanedioate aldolase
MDPGARSVRARWARGQAVAGPFIQLPTAASVEIAARAGFDFVAVDLEHGPYGVELAEQMVRGADARGIAAFVRVQANRPELIALSLELGAAGVLVPHVDSVEDARAAVAAARFHPLGERGLSPTARSADYGASGGPRYFSDSNEAVILGLMIEGGAAYADLDGFLELESVDLIMVAPYDLSQSLGLPGEVTHPRVIGTIEDVCARGIKAGKQVGTFTIEAGAGADWVRRGVRFLGLDVDVRMLLDAMSARVADLRAALEEN